MSNGVGIGARRHPAHGVQCVAVDARRPKVEGRQESEAARIPRRVHGRRRRRRRRQGGETARRGHSLVLRTRGDERPLRDALPGAAPSARAAGVARYHRPGKT